MPLLFDRFPVVLCAKRCAFTAKRWRSLALPNVSLPCQSLGFECHPLRFGCQTGGRSGCAFSPRMKEQIIEAIANRDRAAAPVYVPEFFRLPPTGERDPYFGNSRSQYYAMERAGEIKLVHLRPRGKTRGTCLCLTRPSRRAFARRSRRGCG